MTALMCPKSGQLIPADDTDGEGLLWCLCKRWAVTEPTGDPTTRQVERHLAYLADALSVRTVGTVHDALPYRVRVPRGGQLTRMEAKELSAQLLGCLAAGHPLDSTDDHPAFAEPF